jgi:apolipoprotein N-acyltransferase
MKDSALAVNPMASVSTKPSLLLRPARPFPYRSLPFPRLLPALATATLLSLGYFTVLPVMWSWLGWVALVPMLCLVRSEARPWRVYISAWIGGLAFYALVLQWMRVAHPLMYYTWAMLAVWCSLFVLAGFFFIRRLDRRTRLPLVITVPVVWTGLEYLRAHLLTGFAWYFLGHTQHNILSLIQIADLGGAYAVTLVVAAVNGLVFELVYTRPGFRKALALPEFIFPRRPALTAQLLAVFLLVAATIGYGEWRLNQDAITSGPRVALVQGNIPQAVRNSKHDADTPEDREMAAATISDEYLRLHRIAESHHPGLIVWPETSYPADWQEPSSDFLERCFEEVRRQNQRAGRPGLSPSWEEYRQWALGRMNKGMMEKINGWPTSVLLGLNCDVGDDAENVERYNSAVLLRKGGVYGGRYDKVHRIPWGEYVPLRDMIPAMNAFAPYDHDYSIAPGNELTRFSLGKYHFGVLICFEDSNMYLARQFMRRQGDHSPLDVLAQIITGGMYSHLPADPPKEPPADFLVNISNDGWFDGTEEHEQHLAVGRFRAVECRRSMVRAVNMGISAVIDSNGRVLAPTATKMVESSIPVWEVNLADGAKDLPTNRWHEFKKTAGALIADVPLDTRSTLYARWGDWLPASCWLIVLLGLLWPRARNISGAAAA